jgi:hypothetical protein
MLYLAVGRNSDHFLLHTKEAVNAHLFVLSLVTFGVPPSSPCAPSSSSYILCGSRNPSVATEGCACGLSPEYYFARALPLKEGKQERSATGREECEEKMVQCAPFQAKRSPSFFPYSCTLTALRWKDATGIMIGLDKNNMMRIE